MTVVEWVLAGLSLALGALAFFKYRAAKARLGAIENPTKADRRPKKRWMLLLVACGWLALCLLLKALLGPVASEELAVDIFPERTVLFGLSVSTTAVYTWIVMAVIIVLAVLFRLFVFPRFKDVPKGVQNVAELAVEYITKYTREQTDGHTGANLAAYLFSLAALLLGMSCVELFGARPPTADITFTFSIALVTFVMINYYGIKRKGLGGRLKSLAKPNAAVLPIKIITDIAVPVSLACRLFGNMLGGMIVMELVYMALGSFSVGIPALPALYFNVFHPVIQIFIFVTLSLTFIREAVED